MDAPRLSDLYGHRGPFLSVYADVTRDGDPCEVEIRWKNHEARLRGQGAPETVVTQVGERVVAPTGAAAATGRFIVATEQDGVLLDDLVPCSPRYEIATWSALPDAMAWLADRLPPTPALVAEFDAARGRDGGAAVGVHDTLAGAARGRVATLLLDPETAMLVHVRLEEVDGLDLTETVGHLDPAAEYRGDQLAMAAAAQTSAEVRIVRPGALNGDGIAALLHRAT